MSPLKPEDSPFSAEGRVAFFYMMGLFYLILVILKLAPN